MGKEKPAESTFLKMIFRRREILAKIDKKINAIKIPEVRRAS